MEVVASVVSAVCNIVIFVFYATGIRKVGKALQQLADETSEAVSKLQEVQTALEFSTWYKNGKSLTERRHF